MLKDDVLKYRKLNMLEILYNNSKERFNHELEDIIFSQLDNIDMISIVINSHNFDKDKLINLISRFKKNGKTVSLTINVTSKLTNFYDFKSIVNQFRFKVSIGNNTYKDISKIYKEFKTKYNEIVFMLIINNNNLKEITSLIDGDDFIYNISIDNNLTYDNYWKASKKISCAKEKHPMNIIYDLPCSGAKYKNLIGICPALFCLLCVDYKGNARLCGKSKSSYRNIIDYSFEELFELNIKDNFEKYYECDKIGICFGGCPIFRDGHCNKYCFNKKISNN